MVEFGKWIIYLGLVIFSSKDDEWTKYDSSLAFVLFRHLRYYAIIGTKLRADFEAWLVVSQSVVYVEIVGVFDLAQLDLSKLPIANCQSFRRKSERFIFKYK